MVIRQYDILLANLEPALPVVLLSPDEMNKHIETIIIAPASSRPHVQYPTRIKITIEGKDGFILLDQLRAIEKDRIIRRLGSLDEAAVNEVKKILAAMLVE